MRDYKNIKEMNVKNGDVNNSVILPKKKLNIFSLLLISILTLGGISSIMAGSSFSHEVKNITSCWTPNLESLGKLKFVTNYDESEVEVSAQIYDMSMPFNNVYMTEIETGVFMANGLGGVVVKACLDGSITKVENVNNKKTIYISHGKGLTSVYDMLDNVGVKEGDVVKKNSPLGVSLSSIIQFKVLYKNKILTGLTVKDGELTFM